MTITYPIDLPISSSPSRVEIRQEDIVLSSISTFSAQEKFIVMTGKFWSISLTYPPRNLAEAREFQAFFGKLKGRFGTFLAGDPSGTSPSGSALGTPLVDGANQVGSVLNTKGWTDAESDLLLPGDYIQLGSGITTRLYQVLNAVDSTGSGSGLASIDIWPDIRAGESPSDSESLVLNNAKGTFRLTSNLREISINSYLLAGVGFSAREAL